MVGTTKAAVATSSPASKIKSKSKPPSSTTKSTLAAPKSAAPPAAKKPIPNDEGEGQGGEAREEVDYSEQFDLPEPNEEDIEREIATIMEREAAGENLRPAEMTLVSAMRPCNRTLPMHRTFLAG